MIGLFWKNTKDNWKSVLRGMTKYNLKLVVISGLIVSPEQPWRTCNFLLILLTFIFMSFFMYIGGRSIYYAREDLATFVEISHGYTFVLAFCVLLSVHYAIKVPLMHKIFQTLDTGIFEYKTKCGILEVKKLKSRTKFYMNVFQNVLRSALILALALLTIVGPIMINMYGNTDREKIEQITYNVPVPFWFPFKSDNSTGFIAAYLLVTIEIIIIVIYLIAAYPFLVYGVFEVSTQYAILKRSILNLESRALEKYCSSFKLAESRVEMLRDDPLFEMCVRESLKENIVHHIEILRFFNLYQDFTSTIFGVIIGVSMLILASLSLVLTKTKLSFETVKFAVFFVIELVIVFGYCLMGTFLTNASEEIPSALYHCPWYNLSETNKRMLRIFQYNSGMSIQLRGNGIFMIDLQLFVQIVQTTYSIFNIFSSMES